MTQLELPRTLENISFVSQEYYNCTTRILQEYYNTRIEQYTWNFKNAAEPYFCSVKSNTICVNQQYCNPFNFKEPKKETT